MGRCAFYADYARQEIRASVPTVRECACVHACASVSVGCDRAVTCESLRVCVPIVAMRARVARGRARTAQQLCRGVRALVSRVCWVGGHG